MDRQTDGKTESLLASSAVLGGLGGSLKLPHRGHESPTLPAMVANLPG